MWEKFPFQKVWLSNIRQVPVPGVAVFLSFLSMVCPAFVHVWFPSLHPLQFPLKSATWSNFSLSCTASQPSEGETAKSPKRQDLPTVLPVRWLGRLGDFAVSHTFLHAHPWIHTISFPSQCFCFCSAWLQKERRYSHSWVAFPVGGKKKHLGIFIVVENETQKHFTTAAWAMKVGSRNQSCTSSTN